MSDQEPNEGVGSLFFELAGDLRILMLTKLNQKNYRLSQLATELNATMQEAHRNMTRLIDAGLVAKGREGELMLTVYGRTVVMLMPSYEFLYRNKERKSTRLNSSHANISYAVFCLKKKITDK